MAQLITWGYVILSLGLIISPFFIIRKLKTIKWRHIFLGYFLSAIIFGGIYFFYDWFDKWLYNDVQTKLAWEIMDKMVDANILMWVLLYCIIIVSPFLITKMVYKSFTKKRAIINLLISIALGISLLVMIGYLMVWSMGKVSELYL